MKEFIKITYYIIALIGSANGILLASILILKKRGSKALNISLAILFLSITLLLLTHLIMTKFKVHVTYEHIPFVYCTYLMGMVTLGPSFYFYFRSLVFKKQKNKKIDLLHYILTPLILICYLIFIKNHDPLWDPIHYIALLQFSVYIILISILYAKLIRFQNSKQINYSKYDILWISVLFITIAFIWLIHLNSQLELINFYLFKFQALLLTIILYFAIISELCFSTIDKLHNNTFKYAKSKLIDSDIILYIEKINNFMLTGKRYKDASLTLPRMAKELGISPNIISQVVNDYLKQNFPDFLNSYRIEEAKKMLIDKKNKNYTIASIAYECGFNSLSAFNNAFKKLTQVNPSQYRAKHT